MRRILLTLLLAVTTLTLSAEFRWGPTVGVNVSTLSWKQDLVETHCLPGATAGLQGELMIPGIGFGIGVGLQYQMNSTSVNFGERPVWSTDGFGKESLRFHTLQIPLQLRFKYTRLQGLETTIAPFAFAGPTFSFNLGCSNGKMLDLPAGTVDIQVGAGAELIQHLQIFGGYYWGVSYQCVTVKLDNFSARPQGWFVGAAWLF
ncbi:MAG: PorT family protein [Bacteroides sp.]|nr:PorT family protein [Bacteroides sp.]